MSALVTRKTFAHTEFFSVLPLAEGKHSIEPDSLRDPSRNGGCSQPRVTHHCELKSFPSGKVDKSISIRHSHRRQRPCIDHVVLSDYAVELQDVGDDRIYLVIAERFGFVQRHGASHVVEHGRGVGPETADGLHRRLT